MYNGDTKVVTISETAAKDILYLLHQLPYERVIRLVDELNYGLATVMEYGKLVD